MARAVPGPSDTRTPPRQDGYFPIAGYAAIGNKHTAALVAGDGSIDWLCLPGFASDCVFGALLDTERGGRWTLQPAVPFGADRRYLEGTNVLETTFETSDGVVRVTDLMSRAPARPIAWSEVVRCISGVKGEVPMRWRVEPRFGFGADTPEIERRREGYVMR